MNLNLSAPGKLILSGEHSVVYGKKAIACSLDLRTYLSVKCLAENEKNVCMFHLRDLSRSIKIDEELYLKLIESFTRLQDSLKQKPCARAEESFEEIMNFLSSNENSQLEDKQLNCIKFLLLSLHDHLKWPRLVGSVINIKSDIPLSAGLGSSASFSVCLAAFFLLAADRIQLSPIPSKFENDHLELINRYAFQLERIFHGKPSGLDNSLSTYGRYVLFEKGRILESFESALELPVLIVDSGLPKNTLHQVNMVKCLLEKHKPIIESLMNTIDLIVDKFLNVLKGIDNMCDLGELIEINQGILYALQVSHVQLNEIVNLAEKYGNFAAKITGAGGGGCCFILLMNRKSRALVDQSVVDQLMAKLQEENFRPFLAKLGVEGVRVDYDRAL
jgi:mevalonate kinase